MYEKAFETLEIIKQETEKCYGGEFLVELLRYKMEEEKSNLHIIKEGEQCT